ncbi:MAG: cupin domain-containing protein [Kiritimatiellia bacterium]
MMMIPAFFSCAGNGTNQTNKEDAQNTQNSDSIELFMEYEKTEAIKVSETVSRKFTYLDNLMMVIVDFKDGPMNEPDPFHSHPHEQISYVAEGDVLVIIGDQQKRLTSGDIYVVPSGVPHTVQSLTPTLRLIDSFNPIREDFIKK